MLRVCVGGFMWELVRSCFQSSWKCWPITRQNCLLFRRLKPSQAQKEDETQVLLLTYCFNSVCHWLASRKSVWSQWKQQCQLVHCNRSFNSLWSWNSFCFLSFLFLKNQVSRCLLTCQSFEDIRTKFTECWEHQIPFPKSSPYPLGQIFSWQWWLRSRTSASCLTLLLMVRNSYLIILKEEARERTKEGNGLFHFLLHGIAPW